MHGVGQDPQFWDLLHFFGTKVLYAIACGAIVGLERELKNKSAGIKTNVLICVGSALYTGLSILMASQFSSEHHLGDPGRIAAQIVSGVGFLGGGAIIQSRGTVVGLTTAASIWVMAAIGILVGLGYGGFAILISLAIVLVLVIVRRFEMVFIGHTRFFFYEIMAEDPEGRFRGTLRATMEHHNLQLSDVEVTALGKHCLFKIKYQGSDKDHRGFLLSLWGQPGIKEVRQASE